MALSADYRALDRSSGEPLCYVWEPSKYNKSTGGYSKSPEMTPQELKRQVQFMYRANPPRKIADKLWTVKDLLEDFKKADEHRELPEGFIENGLTLANAVLNTSSAAFSLFEVAKDFVTDRLKETGMSAGILTIMTQKKENYLACQTQPWNAIQGKADKAFMAKMSTSFVLFSVALAHGACPFLTPVGMLFTVVIWLKERGQEKKKAEDYQLASRICDTFDEIRAKAQRLIDDKHRNEQECFILSSAATEKHDSTAYGYYCASKSETVHVTLGELATMYHAADGRLASQLDNELLLRGFAVAQIKPKVVVQGKKDREAMDWDKQLENQAVMDKINKFWRSQLPAKEGETVVQTDKTGLGSSGNMRFQSSPATSSNTRYTGKK